MQIIPVYQHVLYPYILNSSQSHVYYVLVHVQNVLIPHIVLNVLSIKVISHQVLIYVYNIVLVDIMVIIPLLIVTNVVLHVHHVRIQLQIVLHVLITIY